MDTDEGKRAGQKETISGAVCGSFAVSGLEESAKACKRNR